MFKRNSVLETDHSARRSSLVSGRRKSSVKTTSPLHVAKNQEPHSAFHQFLETKKGLPPKMGWMVTMLEEMGKREAESSSHPKFRFSSESLAWIKRIKSRGHAGQFSFSVKEHALLEKKKSLLVGLEETLAHEKYRKVLEDYLLDNGFEQVIDFLEDVRDFRRVNHESTKKSAAKSIYERHISPQSSRAVPLQPSTIRNVKNAIDSGNFSNGIFNGAYAQVFERLQNGDFRRFTQTPMYLEMLPEDLALRIKAAEDAQHSGWINEEGYQSLHVDIISCTGLLAKESGKLDPYVTVSLGSKAYKTKIDKNTQNPNWEEHFELPVSSTSLYAKVCVWSKDLLGNKLFLGQTIVYMSDIKKPFLPDWYPLGEDPEENEPVSGEIHMRFKFSKEPARENKDAIHVSSSAKPSSSVAELVRGKVSKKKKRFVEDGFNLDLTYVTDHLIAMGFPSESLEGFYRNNMKDVQNFFNTRHPSHFKIYNLCSERSYDPSKFGGMVAHYGFDDHNPCPFNLIVPACQDMSSFLKQHPQNVVSIHCKAGKGRTGMILSCYMLFDGMFSEAQDSLDLFAQRRTKNRKGVTIPSQIRWVHYFERFLKAQRVPNFPRPVPDHRVLILKSISILNPVPIKTANLLFKIHQPKLMTFHSKHMKHLKFEMIRHASGPILQITFPDDSPLPLSDDVKINFSTLSMLRRPEKLFHFWFNTRFIENDRLELTKSEIDKAVKDKKHKLYSKNLGLVLEFEEAEEDLEDHPSLIKTLQYVAGLPNKAFHWHEGKQVEDDEDDDDEDVDTDLEEKSQSSSQSPRQSQGHATAEFATSSTNSVVSAAGK